ncbi:MAG: glycosyltransferase family 25 protein [Morganella sp. (in: enterobacteria)]
MNIFVINLKSDISRRKNIQDQADSLGLDIEFIDAVIGNDISDKTLFEYIHDYPNCKLTKGEIGCAFSHLLIYKKIINENITHALILEDDAIIGNNIHLALNEVACIDQYKKPNIYLLSKPHSYIENKKLKSIVFDIHPIQDACGAHGYIINNLAAKKMIQRMNPLKWECDMWGEFKFQKIVNIFCILPTIIHDGDNKKDSSTLEDERSVIQHERSKYRSILRKKEPYYQLRRIQNNILKKIIYKIKRLH